MYLFSPYEYYILPTGSCCCCVVLVSTTNTAAWLWHRMDYCALLLERREPHGIPSPCGHSCMVCATVCLTVMPSFWDITNVSTIGHSFKTDRSRTPLLHVAQYGDDIIGRELNSENCLVGSGSWTPSKQLRPLTIRLVPLPNLPSWPTTWLDGHRLWYWRSKGGVNGGLLMHDVHSWMTDKQLHGLVLSLYTPPLGEAYTRHRFFVVGVILTPSFS